MYGLPGIWPLLDFGNQPPSTGVVQLCSTCVFKVVNVSTNGESHRGKLRTINFFKGEQGSRVILQNGYRLRLVCSTINSTVAALSTTPRSLVFPLPPSGQQQQQLLLPTAGKTFQVCDRQALISVARRHQTHELDHAFRCCFLQHACALERPSKASWQSGVRKGDLSCHPSSSFSLG